jgi:hypothetical protein
MSRRVDIKLSPDEECEFSLLPKAFCSHCLGDDEPELEWEVVVISRKFRAQYPGWCAVDDDHRIRLGDLVAKIGRSDNPMKPLSGVACQKCVRMLPSVADRD